MATVKYDICSKTVAPLSASVVTVVDESVSLSEKTTLPPVSPPITTMVLPAVTVIAVVVMVRPPPVAVLDVTNPAA